jgi:hypothetical protein
MSKWLRLLRFMAMRPLPVFRKRFLAPLCDFNLGMDAGV